MTPDEKAWALKLAINQSRFRDSNERLRKSAGRYGFESPDRLPFMCECADPGCFEIVVLSLQEYERLRSHPSWFLLVAGHEDAATTHERILEAEDGYVIVEKVGAAGVEAVRLSPQRDDGS